MRGAQAVYSACVEVRRAFDDITSRARGRFERRDWRGMQADAVERLEVTPRLVALAVEQLGSLMGRRRADPAFWRAIHGAYAALLKEDPDPQLAQTFFNSVSRRLLGTVGLAEDIDFFTSAPDPEGGATESVQSLDEHCIQSFRRYAGRAVDIQFIRSKNHAVGE